MKRLKSTKPLRQQAFTLIELLLYLGMIGILLTAVLGFFSLVVDARVKNDSVAEINDQGAALMDYYTRTIRNATSITTPATGAYSPTLSLVVPTGSLSPTVFDTTSSDMGATGDGGATSTNDANIINSSKFTAAASGSVSTLYALIGPTDSSPNNTGQMAIYSGATPTTLLASSASTALVPNAWNAFTIPTINVTNGTTYWVAYNTNAITSTNNGLRFGAGAGQSRFIAQTYGTWPSSWAGTSGTSQFSVYAQIDPTTATARVKEGAATAIALTNSNVQINGLTFQNVSRAGTVGNVYISFTLSRVNPAGRNEYDYSQTFSSSAEIGW